MICKLSDILDHKTELTAGQTMLQVITPHGNTRYRVFHSLRSGILKLVPAREEQSRFANFQIDAPEATQTRIAIVSPYEAMNRLDAIEVASHSPISDVIT